MAGISAKFNFFFSGLIFPIFFYVISKFWDCSKTRQNPNVLYSLVKYSTKESP